MGAAKKADRTAAERQRRRRERLARLAAAKAAAAPARGAVEVAPGVEVLPAAPAALPAAASSAAAVLDHPAPVAAPAAASSPSSAPIHTTEPIAAAADEFAIVPLLAAGDGAPGGEGADEPIAPPVEEPRAERPPLSEAEAQAFALAVAGYWRLGASALLARHPEARAMLAALPAEMAAAVNGGAVDRFVYGAALRCGQKYRLALPYQDEIVVAGAIGLATFGLFGPAGAGTDDGASSASSAPEGAAA